MIKHQLIKYLSDRTYQESPVGQVHQVDLGIYKRIFIFQVKNHPSHKKINNHPCGPGGPYAKL